MVVVAAHEVDAEALEGARVRVAGTLDTSSSTTGAHVLLMAHSGAYDMALAVCEEPGSAKKLMDASTAAAIGQRIADLAATYANPTPLEAKAQLRGKHIHGDKQ